MSKPHHWNSFWDLTTPAETAALFRQFYGDDAEQSAIQCAEAAKNDGRHEDHRFWVSVMRELGGETEPIKPGGLH